MDLKNIQFLNDIFFIFYLIIYIIVPKLKQQLSHIILKPKQKLKLISFQQIFDLAVHYIVHQYLQLFQSHNQLQLN